MNLILTTADAALISTAAVADNSSRYNDIFLDTSASVETNDVYGNNDRMRTTGESTRANDIMLNTADTAKNDDTVLSTRNALRSPGEGYVYGGFGPGNDSK